MWPIAKAGRPFSAHHRCSCSSTKYTSSSARIQDTLLPVLEADDRTLRGSRVIIDARDVSFVIATTDWGKLREPFRSRVREVILEPYNTDEVAQMLRYRIEAASGDNGTGADIDPAVAQLGEDALGRHRHSREGGAPGGARPSSRDRHGTSDSHLRPRCRFSLGAPTEDGAVRPARADEPTTANTCASWRTAARSGWTTSPRHLSIDRSNVEGAIEPFLAQMGWIQRGSTGRTLTTSGIRLVARLPHLDA